MENIINKTFLFGTNKYTVVSEYVINLENSVNYSIFSLVGSRGGKKIAERKHNGKLRIL